MDIRAVLKLVIAIAITLEIRPEDLAKIFAADGEIQEYYETLLDLQAS